MQVLTLVGTQHWRRPNLCIIMSHRILSGAGEEGGKSSFLLNVTASSVASGPLLAKGPLQ